MLYTILDFFTDPVLRGPTVGCMLMCAAASLIGVIIFVRRKSLVGEALSHAAYPGLIAGAFLSVLFPSLDGGGLFYFLLGGAFVSTSFAVFLLKRLLAGFHVKSDVALCFILASFLGIGVLLASRIQFLHPLLYRQVQTFLYGQAATMTDLFIWIYGALFLLIALCVIVFYHPLRLVYFDPTFADSLRISRKLFERLFYFLLVLAVIVAMKSVGVVLLSGMFIAPALSARRLTHKLSLMFVLSASLGAIVGFFGNYLSVKLADRFSETYIVFPTGPMIVLFGSCICIAILVCTSSKRKKVSSICKEELIIKALGDQKEGMTLSEAACYRGGRKLLAGIALRKLIEKGLVFKKEKKYALTSEGREQFLRIEKAHLYWKEYAGKEGYKSVEAIENFYIKEEGCSL